MDRAIETAGEPSAEEFTVLVAVDNPNHVPQLLRTAADIARAENGSIHVVSVVSKDYDSPFGIFDDETIKAEFATERRAVLDTALDAGASHDVPTTGTVVVDRDVARGIIKTAREVAADAIVIGWTGPAWRPRAVLGTSADAVLEHAPLDVYVERIGATAAVVDRILVPVAGGPHISLGVRASHAIAAANDASITLFTVTDPDGEMPDQDGAEATDHLAAATAAMPDGTDVAVERRSVADDDVVGTIVRTAADHDIVVMGATRGGHLRSRLVGSVPRAVTDRTDRTVLLARRWTGGSRLTRALGRFRRR